MPSLWSSSSNQKVDPTAEALYEEGTRYFKDKRYARAIDSFTKLKSDYPFSPLLLQTELQIADAYYLNQQYPEAINAFKEFESMHPSNENMPLVTYRLGQSYFDQFTTTDRDQKNTEVAKTYFQSVLTKYPKSQYAADAKEKLAKCNGYLAEHDFEIAMFYLKQEKYPAARDRFEEIVRRYHGTPAAAKSLFYLGDSYRSEKNYVKAALAYEALLQHHPDSPFAAQAQAALAQVENQKQDPLAMLLMRDRRSNPAAQGAPDTATAKKEPDNLVAKTDMVYEEPGGEKGMFRRIVDKVNPFSSSDSKTEVAQKKDDSSTIEQLAKKKSAQDQDRQAANKNNQSKNNPDNTQLVQQIDSSLQQKGIDSQLQTAALTPPAADLPKMEEAPPVTNTAELLGQVDSSLTQKGKAVETVAAPEPGDIFKEIAQAQARSAQAKAQPASTESASGTGLLAAIDQKLKSQGVEPSSLVDAPPVNGLATPQQRPAPARNSESAQKVELQPKLSVADKGPLYLPPTDIQTQDQAPAATVQDNKDAVNDSKDQAQDSGERSVPTALIKAPAQTAAAAKQPEKKKTPTYGDEEEPGMFDQLRHDAENLSKLLNPFSW